MKSNLVQLTGFAALFLLIGCGQKEAIKAQKNQIQNLQSELKVNTEKINAANEKIDQATKAHEQEIQTLKVDHQIELKELVAENKRAIESFSLQLNNLKSKISRLQSQHEGEADNASKPEPSVNNDIVPITEPDENLVFNPANSEGKRYILVEISLKRGDKSDNIFHKTVKDNAKELQAKTQELITKYDAAKLSQPETRQQINKTLHEDFQKTLGVKHPIEKVIISKWIIQ